MSPFRHLSAASAFALLLTGCVSTQETQRPTRPLIAREKLPIKQFAAIIETWNQSHDGDIGAIASCAPTGSMEPYIHYRDIILSDVCTPGTDLKVGMVAVYDQISYAGKRLPARQNFMHMIDAIDGDRVHFNGTGYAFTDEWVYRWQIKRVVRRVIYSY